MMMRRLYILILMLTAAGVVSGARAQAPDIRTIKPVVMLLVDTSLSMEYTLDTPDTTNIVQLCGNGQCDPTCNGDTATDEQNRWAVTLQALTGSFNGFSCLPQGNPARTGSYVNPITGGTINFATSYDYGEDEAHHQISFASQDNLGVLDMFIDRAKFGLMTFDGVPTLNGRGLLMEATSPLVANFPLEAGGFSYGSNRLLHYDDCPTDYIMNTGAKSGTATDGRLISVGPDDPVTNYTTNATIQAALLGTRPYGGTPIAAMLDDFTYFLATDGDVSEPSGGVGDPYYQCRPRYAVLLTDGVPDGDFRGGDFNCERVDAAHPNNTCPYLPADTIAGNLCQWDPSAGTDGECQGDIDGLFVVGLAINNTTSITALDDIAAAGGTDHAYLANDLPTLRTALTDALNQAAPGAVTRTVPAFANSSGSLGFAQLQFSTGFVVGEGGKPWRGLLERTRYKCEIDPLDPSPTPIPRPTVQASDATDLFHETLNATTGRRLWTVEPTVGQEAGWYTGDSYASVAGVGIQTSPVHATSSLAYSPTGTGKLPVEISLATPSVVPFDVFHVADDAERTNVVNWLQGDDPNRTDRRLGDIYYSSPVVVGPPRADAADESFNYFRSGANNIEVPLRPTVVYVGTNDGILHAFVAADHTYISAPGAAHSGTLAAGTELWGFVPPALLPSIKDLMTGHDEWAFAGSPVVKDVYLRREPGQPASTVQYRTVLISAVGRSGVYIALDVTDPVEPKFLWQFSLPSHLGRTMGQPAITQILMNAGSGSGVEERAVAIIPAGEGAIDVAAQAAAGALGCQYSVKSNVGGHFGQGSLVNGVPQPSPGTVDSVSSGHCWQADKGRALAVVDIATGELITLLTSGADWAIEDPLSGSVSVFPGGTTLVSTRGYTTSQDGRTYRLDWTSRDPENWRADVFFDSFHGTSTPYARQPGRYAPIVSTDQDGNAVIIQATGDITTLENAANNVVFSATEKLTGCSGGTCSDWQMLFNWQMTLENGGQVTGPLELFDSNVYFASFHSHVDPTNACAFGESYVWSVNYRKQDPGGSTLYAPLGGFETTPGTFDLREGPLSNAIVMGVSVTQRPICIDGNTETDPYVGGQRFRPGASAGGDFQLVYQTSGDPAGALGRVQVRQRALTPPALVTRASSFAGSTD